MIAGIQSKFISLAMGVTSLITKAVPACLVTITCSINYTKTSIFEIEMLKTRTAVTNFKSLWLAHQA